MVQHPADALVDFRLERSVLRFQICEFRDIPVEYGSNTLDPAIQQLVAATRGRTCGFAISSHG